MTWKEWLGKQAARLALAGASSALVAGGVALVFGLSLQEAAGLWLVSVWIHHINRS